MNRIFLLVTAVVALLFSACASVKSTAIFYTPTTGALYPPKDPHAVIPILNEPPHTPYTEIGRFAFQSQLGYPFMLRAMEYNAQRAGADAVIIKNYKAWSVPSLYSIPPIYALIPIGWYGGGCGSGWAAGGVIPVAYPGYTGVTYQNFIGIDARMILFKR